MNHWAVVQTEPQREHAVRLLLMRQNCETYLPRIKVRNRIGPLFPGYVFVRLAERWYPIMWTPHVERLLMAGDEPAKLRDGIIAQLRKREVDGLVKLPQAPGLKPGQRVRIVRGSFDGQLGIYEGMSGRDRERVLLELLCRKVRVEVPSQHVEPLDLVPVHNSCYKQRG